MTAAGRAKVARTAALQRGHRGTPVRDLQHRLIGAGCRIDSSEIGRFEATTEAAVREFQTVRSVRVDGVVGPETWAALVESGFAIGDRLLYHRSPNLRGDDVLALQRLLNRLGFDSGREDAILGPQTAAALREFQRNSGLSVDGIAGPSTLDAFSRVEPMADGSVASVRERDELRRGSRLDGRRIYLSVSPGFDQIGTPVARSLTNLGAQVMLDVSGADDHQLASRANRWHADLFVATRSGDAPGWHCFYYERDSFRSERGWHAAHRIADELVACGSPHETDGVSGMAFAVLRETRMAAVVCALGDGTAERLGKLLTRSPEFGAAIGTGIRRAFEEPQVGDSGTA